PFVAESVRGRERILGSHSSEIRGSVRTNAVTADRAFCHFVVLTLLLALPVRAQRIPFPPRFHEGQTLVYQLETGGSRSTQVLSRVTGPQSPPQESLTAFCLLQVNVAHVDRDGFRLKTYLSDKETAKNRPDA